jgi:hypothetical protein
MVRQRHHAESPEANFLDARSAAAASDVLGDYTGTLLCDGYIVAGQRHA